MKMPDCIMMRLPHHLAGRKLWKHEGMSFTKDLGAGLFVTIETGDYQAYNAYMSREWLEKNPNIWVPSQP